MKAFAFINNLSAFQRVIICLLLGIATGVFVGERAGVLEIVGTGYIRLLQMTVLPYVLVSVIGGLGRLDASMAGTIGSRGGMVILFLWLTTMATLLLVPLAYPDWETAGFFSSSMLAESGDFDFLSLYIPSNIFYALANTVVPAVVLFSLLMGIALIQINEKTILLQLAANISDGLMKVASFVAKLAPIGIFSIAASAAGILQVEELSRLQVFLWVYLLAWLGLAFIALPLFVHWATPFTYKEVMRTAGEAMVTALATGTVLVVLPMIAERCKAMLKEKQLENEQTDATIDVIVPTAYSFPSVGTLLGLGFVLFSAWYVGSPLGMNQYPSYVIMGALSAFGSMAVSIPFMLDYFNLPADQFQLYLLGSVITARLATAMAALHGFVAALMVSIAVLNKLKWQRLFQVLGIYLAITFAMMTGAGFIMTHAIEYEYDGDRSFEAMRLMGERSTEIKSETLTPLSAEQQLLPRLDVIRERGSIRVGYFANRLPFAFRNDQGNVVGFDMELMHELAGDLDLRLEVFRLPSKDLAPALLANGSIDIIIGGNTITPLRALDMTFSNPYTQHTLGLMVTDSRRDEFESLSGVNEINGLKLGLPDSPYFEAPVREIFPQAELVQIKSPRRYLKQDFDKVDAFIFSAEVSGAWTVLYPQFSVVIPKGVKMKAPVAFGLGRGQIEFAQFLNTWIILKQEGGLIDATYNYWILGENPKQQTRRWSVMEDVLGWGL